MLDNASYHALEDYSVFLTQSSYFLVGCIELSLLFNPVFSGS